jgi:hypothetical protein
MKRISAFVAVFGLVMGLLVSGCQKQESTPPAAPEAVPTNAPAATK